jgi:hypothetical protein
MRTIFLTLASEIVNIPNYFQATILLSCHKSVATERFASSSETGQSDIMNIVTTSSNPWTKNTFVVREHHHTEKLPKKK